MAYYDGWPPSSGSDGANKSATQTRHQRKGQRSLALLYLLFDMGYQLGQTGREGETRSRIAIITHGVIGVQSNQK